MGGSIVTIRLSYTVKDINVQNISHQTPQFLKPCNSIANPFLKSQIRHWAQTSHQGPQASHQLNPALMQCSFCSDARPSNCDISCTAAGTQQLGLKATISIRRLRLFLHINSSMSLCRLSHTKLQVLVLDLFSLRRH